MIDRITLTEKFEQFTDRWSPKLVAELNGQHVKLSKILGEFVWHHHDDADELFFVHRGRLRMELRDGVLELGPGDMCVVPRGVEHRPCADEETEIVLFEPAGTLNTGNVRSERTVETVARI